MNMNNIASYTLQIILFLLSSNHFLGATSNEHLISSLCSKTPEPVICQDCFKSNSNSNTADGRGLAAISVHCGERDAQLLFNFTFNLWESTPSSQTLLKQVLDTCSSQTLLGHDSFRGASVAIESASFNWQAYAINQLTSEVKPFLNRCLDLFNRNSHQLDLPSYILAGTVAVNQDIDIIVGILKNIH